MPKIKNKIKKVIPVLFLLMVFGCVEAINLDTNEDRIVVVNGILMQDEEQSLTLCWSSKNETEDPQPITDADIQLFEGELLVGAFSHQGNGRWTIPFSPKPGETYTIRIQGSGFEEVSASTIMPGDAKVSVWGYPHDMFCEAYFSLRIGKCVGIEVVSEDAESLLWLYVLNQDFPKSSQKIASVLATDHVGVDLFNVYDFSMKWYVNDQGRSMVGHQMMNHYPTERIDIRDDYPLHKYYLRIRHPRDYVRYLDHDGFYSVNKEGQKVVHYSSVQNANDTSIRATANLFRIAGDFNAAYSDLVVLKVSEELDRYMLEGMDRAIKLDEADLTRIYNTENPYSNIKNGTGIFGAALRFYVEDFYEDRPNGLYLPRTYEP